jgi:hypothetical protein
MSNQFWITYEDPNARPRTIARREVTHKDTSLSSFAIPALAILAIVWLWYEHNKKEEGRRADRYPEYRYDE